ncbi:uncharacterized protein EV422DRAFT_523973 [Fimicolochytrium jonesii]|uniref:uncharacterized protein n=1 Tax=Fimicolochytrium jonesii TaxID=1396493 RepID=UPI0022FE37DD|nr:uncharacterized protein EV422DRAFT_523973 [Fimicolochytrium jonesii]KAI8822435.1 hypothetical protein EV422DRAFT_523973 [Fimicolochytrium jonesii]
MPTRRLQRCILLLVILAFLCSEIVFAAAVGHRRNDADFEVKLDVDRRQVNGVPPTDLASTSDASLSTSTSTSSSSNSSTDSATDITAAATPTSTTDTPTPTPSNDIIPAEYTPPGEAYITITSVDPPSVYTSRGPQYISLVGTNYTSLDASTYDIKLTNASLPTGAAQLTVLSDTLAVVLVDTDAVELAGAAYKNGGFGLTVNGVDVVHDIRWVDPVKSIATRVFPSRVIVDNANPVTIVGIGLLPPVGTPLCVFNTTAVSSSPATWSASDATYQCVTPELDQSGVLELNLLYYTPQVDLSPYGGLSNSYLWRPTEFVSIVVNQPLLLYYRAGAPQLISAHFTGTGAIEAEFDRPVAVYDTNIFMTDPLANALRTISAATGRESFGCDKIWSNPSTRNGRLWFRNATAECRVQRMGPRTFRINVGAQGVLGIENAGLEPIYIGDILSVRPGAVWTAGQQLSQTATGGTIVTGVLDKSQIVTPDVRITVPQIVSECADVTYDLSRTMGALGRNFNSTRFTVDPPTASIQVELDKFETAFRTQNVLVYTVPASAFPVGPVTVSFYMQNFLGGSGSASFVTEKLPRSDVPYVTIVGPGNDAPLDQLHTVKAEAHATCGQQRPVSFAWSSPDVPVDGVVTTVVLPQYTMSVQRLYSFVVQAQYSDVPDSTPWFLNYTFTSELDRITPATITELTAGTTSNIEHIPPPPLLLSTSIFDSGYPLASTNLTDFTCIWECKRLDNSQGKGDTGCFKQETGQDLAVPAVCHGANITGFLAPGRYEFDFLAVRISTGAENEYAGKLALNAVDAGGSTVAPMLSISPSSPHPSAWDTYTLTAAVDPLSISALSAVTYTWFSNETCYNETFSTVTFTSNPLVQTAQDGNAVTFSPQSFIPAGRYCFTVLATDAANPSLPGVATLLTTVLEPPAAGYCALNATSGIAYTDVFRYACAGWVTDQLAKPVYYDFWIRRKGMETVWRNLGPRSESSVLDTVLSEGTYELTVHVSDVAGSVGDVQTIYSVVVAPNTTAGGATAPALGKRRARADVGVGINVHINRRYDANAEPTPSDYTFLDTSITSFRHTSDYRTAQTNLIVAIQQLTPVALNTPYHTKLLQLYTLLLSSRDIYMDATSGGPYMAQALQAITFGSWNLTSGIVEGVFGALEGVVAQIDATTRVAGGCVDANAAGLLVKVVDSVVGSVKTGAASGAAVTDDRVRAVLDVLEGCVIRNLRGVCGQTVKFAEPYVAKTVGSVSTSGGGDLSFCSAAFTVPASAVTGSCVRYACGTAGSVAAPISITAGALVPGNQSLSLTLYDTSSSASVLSVQLPNPDISLMLPVPTDLFAQQRAQPTAGFVCAWWRAASSDGSAAAGWATDGCAVASVDEVSGTAVCKCAHLTDFTVALSPQGGFGAVAGAPPAPPAPASTAAVVPDTTSVSVDVEPSTSSTAEVVTTSSSTATSSAERDATSTTEPDTTSTAEADATSTAEPDTTSTSTPSPSLPPSEEAVPGFSTTSLIDDSTTTSASPTPTPTSPESADAAPIANGGSNPIDPSAPDYVSATSTPGLSPSLIDTSPAPTTSTSSAAKIAGGVIGGLLGLALVLLLLFCLRRYRHNEWYEKSVPPPNRESLWHGLAPPPRHRAPSPVHYRGADMRTYGFGGGAGVGHPVPGISVPEYLRPPRWEQPVAGNVFSSRDRLYA